MPGTIRLTGANAAYILEGSDTITEDVVVKFPESGGNYVTEDDDGNVEITGDLEVDGTITAAGDVQVGDNPDGESNKDNLGVLSSPKGYIVARRSADKNVFVGYATGDTAPKVQLQANGDAYFSGSAEFDGSIEASKQIKNTSESENAFGILQGRAGASSQKFGVRGSGELRIGPNVESNDDGDVTITLFASGAATLAGDVNASRLFINNDKNPNSTNVLSRWNCQDADRVTFFTDGSSNFKGSVTAPNTFFSLDPDNPDNYVSTTNADGETEAVYNGPVLDVKESIRNIQSALYRLKAAVLIPDTTVDQLRLRILEALETITEEVD